ncbi:MAG: hypothetical protein HC902_05310 [Calothrix sp. SM1_5_4]|nr:hypothetical protein [Calothrix sp. SM1_5_4]
MLSALALISLLAITQPARLHAVQPPSGKPCRYYVQHVFEGESAAEKTRAKEVDSRLGQWKDPLARQPAQGNSLCRERRFIPYDKNVQLSGAWREPNSAVLVVINWYREGDLLQVQLEIRQKTQRTRRARRKFLPPNTSASI